jgi:hypothetical protein
MSPRFWMIGAGVVLCAALTGFGLGGFAGGRYQGGPWDRGSALEATNESEGVDVGLADNIAAVAPTMEKPPEEIVCTGCGPTLAERNMMGDAYLEGDSDPALRDYQADTATAERKAAAGVLPPAVVATVRPSPPPMPKVNSPSEPDTGM